MQNINLERTRGPRRRTPWWIYAGAVLVAALIIWGVVKVLPSSRPDKTADAEVSDVMIPERTDSETPAVSTEVPVTEASASSADLARGLSPAEVTPLLIEAKSAQDRGDYRKAREVATEIWLNTANESVRLQAEAILNDVNTQLVLTPRDMNEKVDYTVASGDSLARIAKKFGTTVELVQKSNNIQGSLIRIGDRLRVLQGQFSLVISKSDNDLVLKLNDVFFKRYRVGTGEYNKTPVGDFIINDRIAKPTWWRPDGKAIPYGDKENLLGTHWLSINAKGYGIHGTWEPETIGFQASAGCVRLLNEDIEELYTLLPVGTPVTIKD